MTEYIAPGLSASQRFKSLANSLSPLKRTDQGFQSISSAVKLLARNLSSGRDIGLIQNGARCQMIGINIVIQSEKLHT